MNFVLSSSSGEIIIHKIYLVIKLIFNQLQVLANEMMTVVSIGKIHQCWSSSPTPRNSADYLPSVWTSGEAVSCI